MSLFRAREENGKKKWIFKFCEYSFGKIDITYWIGDITEKYKNYKECWEETGGFSAKELECFPESTFTCNKCKYQSNSLIPFLCQQEKFTTEEENNKIKFLEKAFEEEKNKNKIEKKEIQDDKILILNEKINLIMNDLKEIKTAVNDIKNKK